jgi:antitoxin component YwqK of YwqJK toxin-antitoxin module
MPRLTQALRTLSLPLSLTLLLTSAPTGCGGAVDAAEPDVVEAAAQAPIDPGLGKLAAYNSRRASTSDANGVREGFLTLWHDNGVKEGEGQFVAGRKVGPWTWWFKSGQKRWEGTYADDRPDGFERGWYENGMLEYEGGFRAEQRDGPFTRWYDTGQVELRGEYKDGRRVGEFRYWNYDGTLDPERSGVYQADRKVAALTE